MLVRALRKLFFEALALGAFGFLFLVTWFWTQDVSFAAIVLLALTASAIGVTLLVLAILALILLQYLQHRRALRGEIRERGALSDKERHKAFLLRRMDPEPSAYRDPRVVPWWEW